MDIHFWPCGHVDTHFGPCGPYGYSLWTMGTFTLDHPLTRCISINIYRYRTAVAGTNTVYLQDFLKEDKESEECQTFLHLICVTHWNWKISYSPLSEKIYLETCNRVARPTSTWAEFFLTIFWSNARIILFAMNRISFVSYVTSYDTKGSLECLKVLM